MDHSKLRQNGGSSAFPHLTLKKYDWRRSGHKRTCTMHDQPFYHMPDHFASLGILASSRHPHAQLDVWGHDHDGAYRQLPLNDPEVAYVLLITPEGPTLWNHSVLLFGSAPSAWSYNRFGDIMTSISRVLIFSTVLRYVDDYGSMEPNDTAQSSFESFEELNGVLGFTMKPSKRQPPLPRQRMQGVIIESDHDTIVLSPCPQRADNMCKQILKHIEDDCLTSDHACRLDGKCNFLTGRLFGKVGCAPLKAIYARTHCSHSSIDKPTRAARWSLLDIIRHCKPMRIPRTPYAACYSEIYTDAYFKMLQTWTIKASTRGQRIARNPSRCSTP